jgi:hypothetical protein
MCGTQRGNSYQGISVLYCILNSYLLWCVGSSKRELRAERRCDTLQDVGGPSRQQVSMRQTMLAQEILGKKKPPISRGLNSYGMNYLLISKPSFSKKLTNKS